MRSACVSVRVFACTRVDKCLREKVMKVVEREFKHCKEQVLWVACLTDKKLQLLNDTNAIIKYTVVSGNKT